MLSDKKTFCYTMKLVVIFVFCVCFWGSLAFARHNNTDVPITPNLKLVAVADGKSFFADATTKRTWFQARSYCEGMGMTFAAITSKDQSDALNAAYHGSDFNGHFWTSGRDSHLRRQFTWDSTGDAVSEDTDMLFRTDYSYESCLLHHSLPEGQFLTWWHCQNSHGALCTV